MCPSPVRGKWNLPKGKRGSGPRRLLAVHLGLWGLGGRHLVQTSIELHGAGPLTVHSVCVCDSVHDVCCFGVRIDDVDSIEKGVKYLLGVLPE